MKIVYSAKKTDLKPFKARFFSVEGAEISAVDILAQDMKTAQAKADRLLSTMADADYYEVTK